MPKVRLECENCGKEIYKFPSAVYNHNFCSRSCQGTWTMINKNPMSNPEYREKIRKKATGRKLNFTVWNKGRKGLIPWNKGRKFPERSGPNSPNWKGGHTELKKLIRNSSYYKGWRFAIFKRDNFKCVFCDSKVGINADHIYPYSLIIRSNNITTLDQAIACEELWDTNNGRTLCEKCHKDTPSYGSKQTKRKKMNKKKVLVSGSNGLVGSAAVKLFSKLGWEIVGIDNDKRGNMLGNTASTRSKGVQLSSLYNNYKWFEVDIRHNKRLESLFKSEGPFDMVIHAAAQCSHEYSTDHAREDFTINAMGTLNMLEYYRQHSSDAVFIQVSSSKVYGDSVNDLPLISYPTRFDLPKDHQYYEGVDEEYCSLEGKLKSLFGSSKACADLTAQEYANYFNLPIGIFRPVCITGPNQQGAEWHGFLGYLIKCVAQGITYKVNGCQGLQVRDNIHAEDLVNAFYQFYLNPKKDAMYSIGAGRKSNISIIEALKQAEQILNKPALYEFLDIERRGDHRWCIYSAEKFKKDYPNWSIEFDNDKLMHEICSQYL